MLIVAVSPPEMFRTVGLQ